MSCFEIIIMLAAVGATIAACCALWQNNKTQKQILLADLINREFEIRNQVMSCKDDERKSELWEMLFNYFEYISYLVNEKKVDEKPIKDLLGPMMQSTFNEYSKKSNIVKGIWGQA
ncbi:MAG TPA: hypothetical protein ENN38_01250 [Actinobacteria bacterium]|nr:hypothetical protein [Actinomycetota bacterium]